jgi:transcriptional regulator with XRE-family HTH domain
MYNLIFFTNVLRLLDELEMSRNELCDKTDISVSFMCELLNGRANPSLRLLEAIARALNTPLSVLLEHSDLDDASRDILAGGKTPKTVPEGMEMVSVVLPEFQAYIAKQWAASAKESNLHRRRRS